MGYFIPVRDGRGAEVAGNSSAAVAAAVAVAVVAVHGGRSPGL